jgi:hypothetical protein
VHRSSVLKKLTIAVSPGFNIGIIEPAEVEDVVCTWAMSPKPVTVRSAFVSRQTHLAAAQMHLLVEFS